MTKAIVVLIAVCVICTACDKKDVKPQDIDLKLGDTKAIMLAKMKHLRAEDVTSKTKFEFFHAISEEQEYYWWELKDKTIVAVLLSGKNKASLNVAVIEVGEPGKGIEGIANWRSQKLKRITSISDNSSRTENGDEQTDQREPD